MLRRRIQERVERALLDTPVVLLQGARQSGKSTLAQSYAAEKSGDWTYVTLDDFTVLSAAKRDPDGFLSQFGHAVAIDEVQRAPELFLAIKRAVDRDRRSGRFLLTGSANVLLLPRISESLAGRMEILELSPFSQRECERRSGNCIDDLFDPTSSDPSARSGENLATTDLWERVLTGGFPEARERDDDRRRAWFGSYLNTVLQREVRDLASVDALTAMPRLLAMLAARVGGLLNIAELGRALGLAHTSLTRYVTLLEALFLVRALPGFSSNAAMRLVKSRKLFLVDSGLVAYLRECDLSRVARDGSLRGALLENFVVNELTKEASWSSLRPTLYHFRTAQGREVDIVLERRNGDVVGVEVKAAATLRGEDFDGLRTLAAITGPRFVRGIVLYTGTEVVKFAENLIAVPIAWTWRGGSSELKA